MTTFDKREQGFEIQFAHEEELRFKASARCNRLAGMWAAEKLGLTGNEAEAYAKSLVMIAVDDPGRDIILKKISSDLIQKGVSQSDHQIRRTLDDFMKQALADMTHR